MATKYVTREVLEGALAALHDDLKRHFEKLTDEVLHNRRASAGDTREIKEKLMTLQGSIDTLATVVQKLLVDGQTNQTAINALKAEIDRLVAAGSATAAELEALQATIETAAPQIDAQVALLQQLDDSVADPTTPLDGNTPV